MCIRDRSETYGLTRTSSLDTIPSRLCPCRCHKVSQIGNPFFAYESSNKVSSRTSWLYLDIDQNHTQPNIPPSMSNRNDRFRNIAPRPPPPPGPSANQLPPPENTQSAPQFPTTPQTPVQIAPRAASESAANTSSASNANTGTTPKGASGSHTLVACTACRRRKTKVQALLCRGRKLLV